MALFHSQTLRHMINTYGDVKQKSTQFEEEVESQNTNTSNTTEETVDIRNE